MAGELDVVIVGGGPAGATAAALLGRAGCAVRVLEKERFPRFRIGESLLPVEIPLFERLGFVPPGDATLHKLGAEFFDEAAGQHTVHRFDAGLPGTGGRAVHVERAGFDRALLDLARAAGAEVREGVRALGVEIDDGAVRVRADDGVHEARYVVDASGQGALTARQRRTLRPIKGFGLAAAFAHFEGVSTEVSERLAAEGNNVQILMVDRGWAWVIPLPGKRLSIGVVSTEQGVRPADLDAAVARSDRLSWLTRGSRRTEAHLAGDFSYANEAARGARHVCIGDAACFLDPVFSSGVAFAMIAAERMADLLAPALREGREADPDLMAPLEAHMARAYDTFGALIHSFYRTRFVQHLFFHDAPDPELRAGLITILAGDVWRDDNRFQQMLLTSTRRRVT